MKKSLLKKYANLIVRIGANVQPGQYVLITAAAEQHDFVTLVVEECYKAKAKGVRVKWHHQPIEKLGYKKMSLKTLSTVPNFRLEEYKWIVDNLPCMIHIESDDPDGLNGINHDKLQKAEIATYPLFKPYIDKLEDLTHQWVIAAVPSVKWAKKVFPELGKKQAVEALWKAIFQTVRITEDNDPIQAWRNHNETFIKRAKWLNDHNFDYLTYKSSNGTDFRCELIKEGMWHGGKDQTKGGRDFNPNLPTEEIYTSPMKGKCEGKLVATKPLSARGSLIKDFWIEFVDGKATNWDAKEGKEVLEKIITSDEGSRMLGELALIPANSPINNQNILYYSTLFDENACCHVALGKGFLDCIKGFHERSLEECQKLGINDSMVHIDFMIGSDDLEIIGYKDGQPTQIFKDGNWAFEV